MSIDRPKEIKVHVACHKIPIFGNIFRIKQKPIQDAVYTNLCTMYVMSMEYNGWIPIPVYRECV